MAFLMMDCGLYLMINPVSFQVAFGQYFITVPEKQILSLNAATESQQRTHTEHES